MIGKVVFCHLEYFYWLTLWKIAYLLIEHGKGKTTSFYFIPFLSLSYFIESLRIGILKGIDFKQVYIFTISCLPSIKFDNSWVSKLTYTFLSLSILILTDTRLVCAVTKRVKSSCFPFKKCTYPTWICLDSYITPFPWRQFRTILECSFWGKNGLYRLVTSSYSTLGFMIGRLFDNFSFFMLEVSIKLCFGLLFYMELSFLEECLYVFKVLLIRSYFLLMIDLLNDLEASAEVFFDKDFAFSEFLLTEFLYVSMDLDVIESMTFLKLNLSLLNALILPILLLFLFIFSYCLLLGLIWYTSWTSLLKKFSTV